MNFKVKILVISVLAVLLIILINEHNLTQLPKEYVVGNEMITTADEVSYFSPARSFLKTGIWKDSQLGKSAYFTRTPGYGILYLCCEIIYPANAYLALKVLQLLFHFLFLILIGLLIFKIGRRSWLNFTIFSIIAFLPCYSGFVYYTLSESFSLFLLTASFYLSYEFITTKKKIVLPTLFWAITFMVRPQLILVGLLLIIYLFFQSVSLKQKTIILSAFIPLFIWQIRNTIIADSYPGFHPIYHETNRSLFRPPHAVLTDYFRIIDYKGERFHFIAYHSAFMGKKGIKNSLKLIAPKYRNDYAPILIDYQNAMMSARSVKGTLSALTGKEKKFIENSHSNLRKLKNKYAFENYLLTPTRSFVALIVSSNMNLFLYQAPWRTNAFVLILKLLCFISTLVGLFCCLTSIFTHVPVFWKISALGIILSIFYLVYFQRFNEERYIYPFLPFLTLFIVILFNKKTADLNTDGSKNVVIYMD